MNVTRHCTFAGLLATGMFALLAAPAVAQSVVPDKNLEAALREQVFEKRGTDKPLAADDLAKVFVLKARGRGIKHLAGLEKCTNLAEADLSGNEIVDVKPLAPLGNLQSLDLSGNKIADIAPLGGLTSLQYLQLEGNKISDVKPLAKLTALNALYLTGNQIADPAPLGGLKKLWSLYLGDNRLTKLDALGPLTRLSSLELSGNEIADLSPLAEMTDLRFLLLQKNKLTDLAPLVKAAQADAEGKQRFAPFLQLYLADNPLSDQARNDQVAELKRIGVRVHLEDPSAEQAAK